MKYTLKLYLSKLCPPCNKRLSYVDLVEDETNIKPYCPAEDVNTKPVAR